ELADAELGVLRRVRVGPRPRHRERPPVAADDEGALVVARVDAARAAHRADLGVDVLDEPRDLLLGFLHARCRAQEDLRLLAAAVRLRLPQRPLTRRLAASLDAHRAETRPDGVGGLVEAEALKVKPDLRLREPRRRHSALLQHDDEQEIPALLES